VAEANVSPDQRGNYSAEYLPMSMNWATFVAMDERFYFAYMVASRSHTLYVGMTGNLRKRVFEHKQKTHEGFSATYNCNRLVWFERFVSPGGAIAREKQLKGWIRAKKIALIEKTNPTWNDLSEGWCMVEPTVNKQGEPLHPA